MPEDNAPPSVLATGAASNEKVTSRIQRRKGYGPRPTKRLRAASNDEKVTRLNAEPHPTKRLRAASNDEKVTRLNAEPTPYNLPLNPQPSTLERLVFYCRTTSASTAPCTSRRMCCLTHCVVAASNGDRETFLSPVCPLCGCLRSKGTYGCKVTRLNAKAS